MGTIHWTEESTEKVRIDPIQRLRSSLLLIRLEHVIENLSVAHPKATKAPLHHILWYPVIDSVILPTRSFFENFNCIESIL